MQVQNAAIAEAEMSLGVCRNTTILLYTIAQGACAEAAICERHRCLGTMQAVMIASIRNAL